MGQEASYLLRTQEAVAGFREHRKASKKWPRAALTDLPSSCVPGRGGGSQGVLPKVRLPVIQTFACEGYVVICKVARVPRWSHSPTCPHPLAFYIFNQEFLVAKAIPSHALSN